MRTKYEALVIFTILLTASMLLVWNQQEQYRWLLQWKKEGRNGSWLNVANDPATLQSIPPAATSKANTLKPELDATTYETSLKRLKSFDEPQRNESLKHRIKSGLNDTKSQDAPALTPETNDLNNKVAVKLRGLQKAADVRTDGNTLSCHPRLFESTSNDISVSSLCAAHREKGRKDRPPPVQHVFLLKTHKTGSTTLASMLNRYALTHNLTVAVRNNLQEHEAERTTQWTPLYRPLPPGLTHYDMLTDHVRLNEECVRHFLPRDTQFVSIVREPLQAFISAFYYYRDVWSVARYLAVPGPDPIKTFLSDIERWEFPPGTQCNSRMAFDFGLDMLDLPDPQYVNSSLRHLSQVFHQVLLTEQFDESMVLLKRHLHWELKDVLYVKVNVGPTTRRLNVSDHDRKEFEKHRQGEYTLYRHFRRDFEQRIASEGATFRQEVDVFKKMRDAVEAFCTIANKSKARELTVASTAFSEGFRVAYEDCKLLQRMSSTIKDPWFEKLMIERINNLSKALQHWT
ncbi:hypothetical protein V1264_024326 [Littorina saxatilis]|uniref:Galactosylceramide sulfotransferase n=1 Tax=Littorina saxatilis TaxID=31220 RepID=A0AAN9AME1_9CAEN